MQYVENLITTTTFHLGWTSEGRPTTKIQRQLFDSQDKLYLLS